MLHLVAKRRDWGVGNFEGIENSAAREDAGNDPFSLRFDSDLVNDMDTVANTRQRVRLQPNPM
ncbi:MAG: hypothetical protein ACREVV_17455 [Steroidobacteraceae bacterium]